MTDKDKILDKIKKIMALSSSSNEAEATLALEKAQELMAQYGLSEKDVHLSSVGETASKGGASRRPARWESSLAATIAGAFGCNSIHWGKRWLFVGIKPTDEIAAYAFTVLYRQGKFARAAFIKKRLKRCSRINKVIRANSFCEGWVRGLRSKVRDFAGTHEEEKLIEAYLAQFHSDMTDNLKVSDPQNSRLRSLHSDYWKGSDEGENAQLYHAMNAGQGQPVRRLT